MATTIKIRWHGACPKHPKFNPENGGGAVKGGCLFCLSLVRLYREAASLHEDLKQYDGERAAWAQKHSAAAG